MLMVLKDPISQPTIFLNPFFKLMFDQIPVSILNHRNNRYKMRTSSHAHAVILFVYSFKYYDQNTPTSAFKQYTDYS
jgi:hypothetical protein